MSNDIKKELDIWKGMCSPQPIPGRDKKDFVQKNTLLFVCISKKYRISDVILDRLHRIY